MLTPSFSHLFFFVDPIKTLAFFSLLMTFVSLWIKKTPWLWGSFLILSLILAYKSSVIQPIALLPIVLLFILYWMLSNPIEGLGRFLIAGTAFLISGALVFHLLPGFRNWNLAHNLQISPHSSHYNFWLNFDKPFASLFILIWCLPLVQSIRQWKNLLKTSLPLSIIGVVILLFLSTSLGVIHWDPKIPTIFFIWLIVNLFFVVITEEALIRGFLQRELFMWFGGGLAAHVGCVVVSSLVFTLFHVSWVGNPAFLLLIFVAGLIYGGLYQWTGRIESSILCHFLVNVLHFLLFTYPGISSIG